MADSIIILHIFLLTKIKKGEKTAKSLAKHLLTLPNNYKPVPPPADGCAYLLVGDYLTHHIREHLVIIDAGVTTSFFSNTYVKALLRGRDERHCPTYWLKTMRIIRCINDVLTEEIYFFMTEKFL